MQVLAFLDTNMLVSPTQNCGVGGLSQREDPTLEPNNVLQSISVRNTLQL